MRAWRLAAVGVLALAACAEEVDDVALDSSESASTGKLICDPAAGACLPLAPSDCDLVARNALETLGIYLNYDLWRTGARDCLEQDLGPGGVAPKLRELGMVTVPSSLDPTGRTLLGAIDFERNTPAVIAQVMADVIVASDVALAPRKAEIVASLTTVLTRYKSDLIASGVWGTSGALPFARMRPSRLGGPLRGWAVRGLDGSIASTTGCPGEGDSGDSTGSSGVDGRTQDTGSPPPPGTGTTFLLFNPLISGCSGGTSSGSTFVLPGTGGSGGGSGGISSWNGQVSIGGGWSFGYVYVPNPGPNTGGSGPAPVPSSNQVGLVFKF